MSDPQHDRWPVLPRLDAGWQRRLDERVVRFIRRCDWIGAGGFDVTPAVAERIAREACLMTLALEADLYDGVATVIIYASGFVVDEEWTDDSGIVHTSLDERSGEAWERGPVVLAWDEIVEPNPDSSLVVHEFAHRLDGLNGVMNGYPPLRKPQSATEWSAAFGDAYADLERRVDTSQDSPIDLYAAEDPAECFAVFSEVFFRSPTLLLDNYPRVYEQLRQFYRQDPRFGDSAERWLVELGSGP